MNFYRDKITAANRTIRANVYVASTDTVLGGAASTHLLNVTVITVTVPPSQGRNLSPSLRQIEWAGATYIVQGNVVPIMALGRVDHYRIVAQSIGGA